MKRAKKGKPRKPDVRGSDGGYPDAELADAIEMARRMNGEVPRLDVRNAGAMELRCTTWIAPGWVPRGALSVLVGNEGIGKSLWWVRLVAHITTGSADPGMRLPSRAPENVLLILTEDPWSEVAERLRLAGADLARIFVLSESNSRTGVPTVPGADMTLIWDAAVDHEVGLVVVDAWLDTVPSGSQVKDTQGGRAALSPWALLAERTGAGVLLIAHSNRLGSDSLRDLVGGTIALRQKARMLLFAAAPEHERGVAVYVGPDKVNLTAIERAQRYPLETSQVRETTAEDPGTCARLGDPEEAVGTIQALASAWYKDQQRLAKEQSKPSVSVRLRDWLRGDLLGWEVRDGFRVALAKEVQERAVQTAGFAASSVRDNIVGAVCDLGGTAGVLAAKGPHFYRIPEPLEAKSAG